MIERLKNGRADKRRLNYGIDIPRGINCSASVIYSSAKSERKGQKLSSLIETSLRREAKVRWRMGAIQA